MAQSQYWIMKTEPGEFSYQDLVDKGWTHWDGVRNHQAKKNLAAMQAGDLVFIYHSVTEKALVGLGKIAKTAYPDPTDETAQWLAVRVEPVMPLKEPVTLQAVKETPALADIALVRQSRLSVIPIDAETFNTLLKMAKTKVPASAH